MKKIFITILLAALMPFAAGAQDARQRTAETIVADALAQLPAQTPKAFDSLMQELAATGADGIRMMAAMLVPAAEGKNAPVEYAINGVVSYVTAAGREELAREIRAGLTDAVAASTDKPNQAFLLSQLQLCATAAEAPVFVKYAADEYLADYAVRGLISTPGTDGEILALIDASPAPDALLAYAAAEKRLAAAEPALLKWAADPKAGTPTKVAVYNALAKCGTAASIAPLAAAAKADGYAFTKTDATGAYVALLARLAAAGNSKAVAAAQDCIGHKQGRNNDNADADKTGERIRGDNRVGAAAHYVAENIDDQDDNNQPEGQVAACCNIHAVRHADDLRSNIGDHEDDTDTGKEQREEAGFIPVRNHGDGGHIIIFFAEQPHGVHQAGRHDAHEERAGRAGEISHAGTVGRRRPAVKGQCAPDGQAQGAQQHDRAYRTAGDKEF